jgi:hypothetical protein
MTNGDIKPVTWLYHLPVNTTIDDKSEPGTTMMLLDSKVILTIISSKDYFKQQTSVKHHPVIMSVPIMVK